MEDFSERVGLLEYKQGRFAFIDRGFVTQKVTRKHAVSKRNLGQRKETQKEAGNEKKEEATGTKTTFTGRRKQHNQT
ncbi:hypothetical protein GCM10028774_51140 [Spirosoma jeollabukense]